MLVLKRSKNFKKRLYFYQCCKGSIYIPAGINLLKVNNRNIRTMVWNMFKVNNKATNTTPVVVLVALLLTLNIFHTLF